MKFFLIQKISKRAPFQPATMVLSFNIRGALKTTNSKFTLVSASISKVSLTVSYIFFFRRIRILKNYFVTRKSIDLRVTKYPRKKRVSESLAESHLSHAYNPIQDSGETLGEREKFRQKSHQESRLDSW